MVKQCIAAASRPAAVHARLPILEKDMPQPILNSLGRILPTEQESKENVRARSAVLRVAERTSTPLPPDQRSEEHTSELQSHMRNSYAVCCLNKKTITRQKNKTK